METDQSTSQGSKRSAGDSPTLRNRECKKAKDLVSRELTKRFSDLIGWAENTIAIERTKKLTIATAKAFNEKLTQMRDLFSELALENSRLRGEQAASEHVLQQVLVTITEKIASKQEANVQLQLENSELKRELETLKASQDKCADTKPGKPTYADTAARAARKPSKQRPNSNTRDKSGTSKASRKKMTNKSRRAATGPRFELERRDNVDPVDIRKAVWQTVLAKTSTPRVNVIRGKESLIIIPDDETTLNVLRGTDGLTEYHNI